MKYRNIKTGEIMTEEEARERIKDELIDGELEGDLYDYIYTIYFEHMSVPHVWEDLRDDVREKIYAFMVEHELENEYVPYEPELTMPAAIALLCALALEKGDEIERKAAKIAARHYLENTKREIKT